MTAPKVYIFIFRMMVCYTYADGVSLVCEFSDSGRWQELCVGSQCKVVCGHRIMGGSKTRWSCVLDAVVCLFKNCQRSLCRDGKHWRWAESQSTNAPNASQSRSRQANNVNVKSSNSENQIWPNLDLELTQMHFQVIEAWQTVSKEGLWFSMSGPSTLKIQLVIMKEANALNNVQ